MLNDSTIRMDDCLGKKETDDSTTKIDVMDVLVFQIVDLLT